MHIKDARVRPGSLAGSTIHEDREHRRGRRFHGREKKVLKEEGTVSGAVSPMSCQKETTGHLDMWVRKAQVRTEIKFRLGNHH